MTSLWQRVTSSCRTLYTINSKFGLLQRYKCRSSNNDRHFLSAQSIRSHVGLYPASIPQYLFTDSLILSITCCGIAIISKGNNCSGENGVKRGIYHGSQKFAFSTAATGLSWFLMKEIHFWQFHCIGEVKTKRHAKFGDNRINGSKVIKVFVNFKMAAGGHLGLWISGFWECRPLSYEE